MLKEQFPSSRITFCRETCKFEFANCFHRNPLELKGDQHAKPTKRKFTFCFASNITFSGYHTNVQHFILKEGRYWNQTSKGPLETLITSVYPFVRSKLNFLQSIKACKVYIQKALRRMPLKPKQASKAVVAKYSVCVCDSNLVLPKLTAGMNIEQRRWLGVQPN